MGAEGRVAQWGGSCSQVGCGGQVKTGGGDPTPRVEELVSEDVGDSGSPGSTSPRSQGGSGASRGGGQVWAHLALRRVADSPHGCDHGQRSCWLSGALLPRHRLISEWTITARRGAGGEARSGGRRCLEPHLGRSEGWEQRGPALPPTCVLRPERGGQQETPLTCVARGAGRVSWGSWGSLAWEQPKGQVCGWQEAALTGAYVGLRCSGC